MKEKFELSDKLEFENHLSMEEWCRILQFNDKEFMEELFERARKYQHKYYGNGIFIRGLIEISNICKNNCYYCGIRRDNKNVSRYRLSKEQILECCDKGYKLGYRTFVMQGGEDGYFSDEVMTDIISTIKSRYSDCAVTLSLGERSYESYRRMYEAGADRYLLRHETADNEHYRMLHPKELSLEERKQCLFNLKEIGYQVGTGFMVGSPGQTITNIAKDLLFLEELKPQMVGIGPFIPHHDTVFAQNNAGSVELTIYLIALIRLLLPKALIPATTALGTLDPKGREKGIMAGANVIMPNLSPVSVREKYSLYDNKLCTGDEDAAYKKNLEERMKKIGYEVLTGRGDASEF